MWITCANCNNWFNKRKDDNILTCPHCEPLYPVDAEGHYIPSRDDMVAREQTTQDVDDFIDNLDLD